MTRFCTACGTPLADETARFCTKCGAAAAAPPTSQIAKGKTTSYKKVFFSTYAVIAAIVSLIVVLWIAADLRSKYEEHVAEQHEHDAKQQAVNLEDCNKLLNTVATSFGNYGNDSDIQQKIAAEGNWIYEHSVRDVYDDGRGDFYDGMTNEDYAACQTRFAPELKQAQAKADEAAAKEAKKAQEIAARNTEAARLAGTDYFQSRRITFVCGGDHGQNCQDGQLTVTEPMDAKSQPSKKQLACALAEAKFQYGLFDAMAVQKVDRDPNNEVTGLGTSLLYVVPANPWPQDFTAPAGCQ